MYIGATRLNAKITSWTNPFIVHSAKTFVTKRPLKKSST